MRRFFYDRLTGVFGAGAKALAFIVLLTSLIFGIGHHPLRGAYGAAHAFLLGLVFDSLYLRSGNRPRRDAFRQRSQSSSSGMATDAFTCFFTKVVS